MLMYASSDWNLRDFMNRQAGGQTQFDMTTQMYRACSCLRLRNDRKPAVTSPIGRSIVLRHHAGRRLCSITSTTIHWIMWIHAIPATTASRCGKLPTKGRTQRKHGCFFGRLSKQERYGKGEEQQESAHKLSIARVSHLLVSHLPRPHTAATAIRNASSTRCGQWVNGGEGDIERAR